jgi:tetratricopeptide (TPR) repeat protein
VDAREAESLLELAEHAGPALVGLDRKAQFERLEASYDDLLAAMQWFLDEGRADEAIRIARSLNTFWSATGRVDEGCEWFSRVLAAPLGDDVVRGRGLFEAGLLELWRGGDVASADLHRRALEVGDPTVTALALTGLARIALRTDVEEARRLCREALELAEALPDPAGRSNAIHVLGVAAQMNGDLLEARDLMGRRMELARELGSYGGVASEAANLSVVERQLGNLERAEELAREALDIARQREDEWLLPYVLSSLAAVAVERGEFERAATLIGAAETMMRAQGTEWPPDERPHYERTLARLDEAMEPAAFERVRAAGQSLATSDAVAYALA